MSRRRDSRGGQRRNRNRKTEAEATDLEEVGEIGIVATVLRLEIGEALELGGDLQHVVHHLPPHPHLSSSLRFENRTSSLSLSFVSLLGLTGLLPAKPRGAFCGIPIVRGLSVNF